MFTGIVEELGRVRRVAPHGGGARIEIEAHRVLEDAAAGGSIAVNGCCLTVVERAPTWWAADAVVETLSRTTLGRLEPGDPVNLERPLRAADRLGGHIVAGHVDGVGTVVDRRPLPDGSTQIGIQVPDGLMRYVVEKGSVAVDGVSLTVAAVDDRAASFTVALIPHTAQVTTLGGISPGGLVNLEVDLVAKYVERLAALSAPPPPGRG